MDTINEILRMFYKLLLDEKSLDASLSFSKAGHLFEDKVAGVLSAFNTISEVKVRRPIGYPTISGMKDHQFDCSFKFKNAMYVVECKKQTKVASKNQIYYFNSTITDHILGMKVDGINDEIIGIFLSTTDLDDKSMVYAITNGIKFVTPSFPPLEYMLGKISEQIALMESVEHTITLLPNKSPLLEKHLKRSEPSPAQLYEQYRALLKECEHNMYRRVE